MSLQTTPRNNSWISVSLITSRNILAKSDLYLEDNSKLAKNIYGNVNLYHIPVCIRPPQYFLAGTILGPRAPL